MFFLMTFTACGDAGFSNLFSSDAGTSLKVQYIRTDEHSDSGGVKYPVITVVSSKTELDRYYNNNKDIYYLGPNYLRFRERDPDLNYADEYFALGFIEAIENYSDTFFADNFLVLVLLEEGSGSIRHKVERIDKNGDIAISRLIPEGDCTGDMAEWHIIIERGKDTLPKQFRVVFTDK